MTVLKPEATLTCPMVAWLDDWLATPFSPPPSPGWDRA